MNDHALRWTRWALVLVVAALTAIGILFVHSTTAHPGETFPGVFARKQMVRLLVGVLACIAISRLDYRIFYRLSYVAYALLVCVLGTLLVMKYAIGDKMARWITLPFFQIQPSELMKICMIVCLARYLCFRDSHRRLTGLAWPYVLTFGPMALVALQPDLGTSLMFPPVLLGLLFVARARLWALLTTLIVGVGALPAAYYLRNVISVMHDYQMERLSAFFEPSTGGALHGRVFQLGTSMIALGSGGLRGTGFGRGSMNTIGWPPARHTDFIFSTIGEEWGFIGAAGVTLLFLVFVVLCFRVALRTREPFGRLAACGVGIAFAVQSVQNIGMTMGLTPITGLTLPFVSYGGSSLVSSYLAFGLVVTIASRQIRVVASADLDPQDAARAIAVLEDRPAGSILSRWPV